MKRGEKKEGLPPPSLSLPPFLSTQSIISLPHHSSSLCCAIDICVLTVKLTLQSNLFKDSPRIMITIKVSIIIIYKQFNIDIN